MLRSAKIRFRWTLHVCKTLMKRAKRSKMKPEKRFNILDGFDYNLLNDTDFGEDSVREEIILPILKGLGYSANKPYRIIRSKKLLHPYVSIGSLRKKIYLIPDYLFEINNTIDTILFFLVGKIGPFDKNISINNSFYIELRLLRIL